MIKTKTARPNYFGVFILLAVFTLIETSASYLSQPVLKFPILIVLAVTKAVLVLLYFMHLKFDQRLFSYLFAAGCVLSIPLVLVMTLVMPIIAGYR